MDNPTTEYALLITAYNELPFLAEMCKIYSKYFKIYIHIDKKFMHADTMDLFKDIPNVTVVSKYRIYWGSYKHFMAILDMLALGIKDGIKYFSIISANTMMVRHPEEVKSFFKKNEDKIFIECKKYSDCEKGSPELFYEFDFRTSAYFFQHIYNRNGKIGRISSIYEKYGSKIQRKLGLRKNVHYEYKGYIYCHMPADAAQFVIDYAKTHPKYVRDIKYCYVGQEFFFQNIFMCSEEYKDRVVNNCLIYDIWSKERGLPAALNPDDFDDIMKSDKLFARKISKNSVELIEMIRNHNGF